MGNCGSNNNPVEDSISPRSNQPTRLPSESKENSLGQAVSAKKHRTKQYKLTSQIEPINFTSKAEVIR